MFSDEGEHVSDGSELGAVGGTETADVTQVGSMPSDSDESAEVLSVPSVEADTDSDNLSVEVSSHVELVTPPEFGPLLSSRWILKV